MAPARSVAALLLLLVPAAARGDTVRLGRDLLHRTEWRASTFAPGSQHQAALAAGPDDELVAVWSSRRQQAGRAGVYAQRFAADGAALGGEVAVGLCPAAHQTRPAAAADARGQVWVVWESFGQDGAAGGIFARRFDRDLAGGPEIPVNEETRGHQSGPAVALAPDGRALIVWTSALPGAVPRLRGRAFDVAGRPAGGEFAPGPAAPRWETGPSAACGPDGVFAVAFGVFDERGRPAGIRLLRVDAAGRKVGREIDVSGPPRRSQIEPALAAAGDGFVVAWLDAESDGDGYGVLARRLDGAGRPRGAPFVVNTTCRGDQSGAAVAGAPDGRFVIAWNDDAGAEGDIRVQAFAADGAPEGIELRLTRQAAGPQALHGATGSCRLVLLRDGGLACAWSGDAGLGDPSSVNITRLAAGRPAPDGRARGVTAGMRPAAVPAAAEPHRPPVFDPLQVDDAEREFERGERLGFTGIVNTGWAPPDPHLAVGPGHLVVMTNGAIAFFTKDGTLTFQDEIEGSYGFWGGVGASGFVFDPEVLYDGLSGRFFALAAEAYAPPGESRSYALVAVSDDADPNGTWYKYRFETTGLAGNLFDSPNLGVDEQAVYVTGDGFGLGPNYAVYIFDKAALLAGQPPAVQRSLTLPTSTQSAGLPPVSYDSPPALYLIEHAEGLSRSTVRLIALRDPLGSPYFTTHVLSVPTYSDPGDAPQLGTSTRLETFDARFWSVAFRDGSLWATHHINSSPLRARWYQIAMHGWPASGSSPELVQCGDLTFGSGIHAFFSSIAVSARGDAVLTCARSATSEYVSMVSACRCAGDPPGTLRTPVIERTSTGPYTTAERWGDYSAVGADPADPRVFWAHHQYALAGSWRTWVAQVLLPVRLGDLNCDGVVDFADIDPFVVALARPDAYAVQFPACDRMRADCDGDGDVDFADIDPFVALLGG